MTTSTISSPSSDERVMAALAYFFGLIGALLVWAIQKDKSRFVKFHALQALAFEGGVMLLNVLLMVCLFGLLGIGSAIGVAIALQNAGSTQELLPTMMLPLASSYSVFFCLMPIALALSVIRLVAAVSVASGHNFRYPWLARQVDAFMAG